MLSPGGEERRGMKIDCSDTVTHLFFLHEIVLTGIKTRRRVNGKIPFPTPTSTPFEDMTKQRKKT